MAAAEVVFIGTAMKKPENVDLGSKTSDSSKALPKDVADAVQRFGQLHNFSCLRFAT